MSQISVFINHSGKWIENRYIDYKVDAIMFRDHVSFGDFVGVISQHIGVDLSFNCLIMKYKIIGCDTPIEIHNDMGVRVFLHYKKEIKEFGISLLCVCVVDKHESVSNEICFFGEVVQNQISGVDTNDTLAIVSADFVDPVDMSNAGDDLIISNRNQKIVAVDQVYRDREILRDVMMQYSIDKRFNFRTKRSNALSYTLICISPDCKWTMRASSINKSNFFRIRSFVDEHTCPLKDKIYSQYHATSSLVGGIVQPKLVDHKRNYTPKDIRNDMKTELGVDITYMKAWRGKEKALHNLRGRPSRSYRKLPSYLYMLETTYPGSHIRMKKSKANEFLYLYVSLYSFIRGFDHCRPIVVVDGSCLRNAYNGTFVSASTLDGAGNILPLAYGVIDSENDAGWTWFFEQFKEAYGERENLCVVSDRNDSIIKAVNNVFAAVPHYACIWHLWNNVGKRYSKSHQILSEVFYTMAKAYTRSEFEQLMEKVEKVDRRVKAYLELAGYEKWARIYAPINRGWTMTSNIAESINGCLLKARELPMYDFLEEVRLMFARWNCNNMINARNTFTILGKKFQEMLVINEAKSTRMTVVPSSDYVHNVIDGVRNFIVCLEKKKCSCGRFQLEEIPCSHAWAVLKSKHLYPDDYCSDYYKPSTVMKTYEIPIQPLPDKTEWRIPEYIAKEIVMPPKFKRPPGRPKKQRDKPFRELYQKRSRNSCSVCGYFGHNRRSCRNAPRDV